MPTQPRSALTELTDSKTFTVNVVCTGNICRSPMGEYMLRAAIEDAGLENKVTVVSRGTHGWHENDSADYRALTQLNIDGFDGSPHKAHQFNSADCGDDLFLAMAQEHANALERAGVDPQNIRLFRSFDPHASTQEVDDPYYGDQSAFARTSQEISAALPGIIDFIRENLH